MSEAGIKAFYDRMEKDGWTIKGAPVENLLKAMRGFAKNHKRYQKQTPEYAPEEEPEEVYKSERWQEQQANQEPELQESEESRPDTNDKAVQLEWIKKKYGENVLEECGISEEEFYNEQN